MESEKRTLPPGVVDKISPMTDNKIQSTATEATPVAELAGLLDADGMSAETGKTWVLSQCTGASVLVADCGDGEWALLLAEAGCRVLGIDSNEEKVRSAIARRDAEELDEGQLEFRHATLDDLSESVDSRDVLFDSVLLTGKMESFDDLAQRAVAACSLLQPGGRLVLKVSLSPTLTVLPRELMQALPAKLQVVSMELGIGTVRACAELGHENPANDVLALTEAELERALAVSQQARRKLLLEHERLHMKTDYWQARLEHVTARMRDLENSTSFRLGYAQVMAFRSPTGFLRLPLELARLIRGVGRRRAPAVIATPGTNATGVLGDAQKASLKAVASAAVGSGFENVLREIDAAIGDASPAARAMAYLVAGRACADAGNREMEFQFATLALETHRTPGSLRGFLQVALRTRKMVEASAALREIHAAEAAGSRHAHEIVKNLQETSSYKIAVLEQIKPRPGQWVEGRGNRLAYVLHNTLPYSSGGYATRSHGVASGLMGAGQEVVCMSRPGYPLDIRPELAPADVYLVDRIDGVVYQRALSPLRTGIPEYQYVLEAADRMEAEFRRLNPKAVMAASNYVTGLPALIAARRIGIPFFYEVRGLWEITRMSRDEKFAGSISFDVQRHIESTLAAEAEHVFTLTEPMREELIARGVEAQRITLLPNSVDVDRFTPRPRDQALAAELGIGPDTLVIGYIGTFVDYEGLEDLAAACVKLHQRGHDFRLLLVGNENASGAERGPITEKILRVAAEGGIESKLMMPGRIPHEQVESYYSLLDICPFPRKPWPVCEMVSPMKPLEALAMRKAVVVSSVRALREMVQHDETGVVYDKGDVDSLATALERLLENPELREKLGCAGRDWVGSERT